MGAHQTKRDFKIVRTHVHPNPADPPPSLPRGLASYYLAAFLPAEPSSFLTTEGDPSFPPFLQLLMLSAVSH